jgi:hypothetical protein
MLRFTWSDSFREPLIINAIFFTIFKYIKIYPKQYRSVCTVHASNQKPIPKRKLKELVALNQDHMVKTCRAKNESFLNTFCFFYTIC